MPDGLFPNLDSAVLSRDGVYRYRLERVLGTNPEAAYVLWIMLNPSTADASTDDQTIRKCRGFSQRWGYERLVVVNLFAFRTPSPRILKGSRLDPIGPENDSHIVDAAREADLIVCAWGNDGRYRGRDAQVVKLLADHGITRLRCLGFPTLWNAPRHPLYPALETELRDYTFRH